MSPTRRSLKALRGQGWICAIVEKTVPYRFIKQDLWGFDIAAMRNGVFMLVQITSGSNHAARRLKLRALPTTAELLKTAVQLRIHSWAKKGPRGKRKTWTLREEEIVAGAAVP